MATKTPPSETLRDVGVNLLIPTPDNPRRDLTGPAMNSLQASIAAQGVLVPLLARPHPKHKGKYDVRAGHRRLVAARAAGLSTVPVIVRDMDDRQAIECTVTENLQREDLTPLEEARGIRTLLDHKWDIESIASKLGKSSSWIARRAHLTELIDPIAKLAEDEKSPLSRAPLAILERIARLPAETQQELLDTLQDDFDCMELTESVKDFDDWLARDILHALKSAPWPLDDTDLLPEAADCTECMKQSGRHPLLWDQPDKAKAGNCLDAKCFNLKQILWVGKRVAQVQETHPDAVLLAKGHGPMVPEKDLGRQVLTDYQVTHCKKSAKGAKPALVVGGPGAGHIEWVQVHTSSSSRLPRGRQAGKPLTLKQRRAALEPRRSAYVVDHVRERLYQLYERPASIELGQLCGETDPPAGTGLSVRRPAPSDTLAMLLVVFGTERNAKYADLSDWKRFDGWCQACKRGAPGPHTHIRQLAASIFSVWASRLNRPNNNQVDRLLAEAKRMAPFIGADIAALGVEAVSEIPEPKGWARLNADGTPKSAGDTSKPRGSAKGRVLAARKPKRAKKGARGAKAA